MPASAETPREPDAVGVVAPPSTGTRLTYRGDIDGLRAVAVGLVIMYHYGVPWMHGGYVGVDVFFVISGYLVTRILVQEGSRGPISLMGYYANRMRRLLPLSTVVLVLTVAAGIWLLPASRATTLMGDGRAALLYVANWHFASKSVAYVDVQVADGLLTHYWSLSVEEQFYFVWPAILVVCGLVARRFQQFRLSSVVRAVALVVVLVSLVLSVKYTASIGGQSYYYTHLRLWEMGSGALLAVAGVKFAPRAALKWVLSLAAVGAIVWSALVYDTSTPFPGSAAMVPVFATVVLLAIGGTGDRFDRTLGSVPMRWVGERSYALYLWHWPVLGVVGLVAAQRNRHLTTFQLGMLALVASLILAAVSHRLVENPVRYHKGLKRRPKLSLAVGLGATLALVLMVVPLQHRTIAAAVHEWSSAPMTPVQALEDTAQTQFAACNASLSSDFTKLTWCEAGDPNGAVTIALVGDSHAQHWAPAWDAAGKANGWKVIIATRSSCLVYGVPIFNARTNKMDAGCLAWGQAIAAALGARDDIGLVVVGRARAYANAVRAPGGAELSPADVQATLNKGIAAFVAAVASPTRHVALMEDTPWARSIVPDCLLGVTPDTASRCDFPAKNLADEIPLLDAERAAIAALPKGTAAQVSLDDLVCPDGTCHAVTPTGIITYRDGSHLSATYSRSLSPQLATVMAPLVPTG